MPDAGREQQIIEAIRAGESNASIAKRLRVRRTTVIEVKRKLAEMAGTLSGTPGHLAGQSVPMPGPRAYNLAERVAELIDENLKTAAHLARGLRDDDWLAGKSLELIGLLVNAQGQLSTRALDFLAVVRPVDPDPDDAD